MGIWRRLRGRVGGALHLVPHQVWCTWSSGRREAKEGTSLCACFHVTDLGEEPVRLVAARLVSPAVGGEISVKEPEGDRWGEWELPRNASTEVKAEFFVSPPIHAPGKFIVADVVIVDQLAREYRRRAILNPS